MKKISFYMTALLSLGLVACNEDFATEFVPQTNQPESTFPATAVTVTPTASTINLVDLLAAEEEQPIQIGQISLSSALPANTVLTADVELSRNEDFSQSVTISANSIENNIISVMPSTLEDAYYGSITKNPATTDLYMRMLLYTVTGGEATTIIGTPGANYYGTQKVTLIPENRANISPAYYIIGGPNDWAGSAADKPIKFNHSGQDVYEDPIFTVVFDAAAEGDTWFAIGDDAACDAIVAGDWSKLLGVVGGNSQSTEGQLDFRYNMGADNSFCVPAGPKKIKVTLNMLEYTFKIESVNIADAYYLIGGPGEWSAESALTMPFSHSSLSVADDPVFTYVFAGTGTDMWFAFGDKDAIDGVASGDWTKLYGTTGASEDLIGSVDRRYNLDGDHSFHVDGTAKFYRFQIDMADLTYTITALNFAEYLYEAGVNNDWGGKEQPLYCGDGNGTYVGFFYAQDADWSEGKGAFKFRGAADNWDNGNYGTGTINDDGLTGTLINDGNSGNILVEPGFYRAEVNLADLTFTMTPIKGIGIIGPAQAGGWGEDTDMTYNPATGAWEATIELAADEMKFRANDDWAINWGGDTGNLMQDGANIKVAEAGTYFVQFFPLCQTKSYCTMTKQ
ncbi:MAG: hypothetical protein K5683_05920 [Prevotella sp.]|nr:hypothetical protein [Prevotella sp.]